MAAALSGAETMDELIRGGNQLYQQEDYTKALAQYDQAQSEAGENEVLHYDRANCFYKLEDYTQAINLYKQVSAEAKDMKLVARAKYNLGNCYYQEGIKQRDSDLQKALEAFTNSVRYYREALDMNPQDTEAKHNIAVVRLVIKDILDQLQKQKEEKEKNKSLPEKIKDLLGRQKELQDKASALQKSLEDPNTAKAEASEHCQNQAQEQKQLKEDTSSVRDEAQQMQQQMQQQQQQPTPQQSTPQQGTPQPSAEQIEKTKQALETAAKELSQALDQQESAANNLQKQQVDNAIKDETQAAQSLENALKAFGGQDQQQQQQQQQHDEQQQQNQQEIKQQQAPDATAQAILDREKELKEHRRRQMQRGGYRAVEKDW